MFSLILTLLALFFTDIHGGALDDLAFGCADHGVLHLHNIAIGVEEDRSGEVKFARHQGRLDQLEVELLGRIVAEHGAIVREVQLEVVGDTECVSIDRLWHKGVKVVVVTGMLAKEAGSWRTGALASNLELKNHLLLFSGTT